MGIQDRDYYWEKHKEASKAASQDSFDSLLNKTPQRYRHKARKSSGIRYLLYIGLMMGTLWFCADAFLKYNSIKKASVPLQHEIIYIPVAAPTQVPESANPVQSRPVINNARTHSSGVIIKADAKGHFRGTVLINNVPMPFLIDTGATDTVIPFKMAVAAKLPYGGYVQTSIAGGKIAVREILIKSLKLGNAEVLNLNAQMNDYLDEVLIGMSTLRYFKMTQNEGTMTLIANAQHSGIQNFQNSTFKSETAQKAEKMQTNIKKTVNCDKNKVCTTKYSDH
jgi:aspartyl protease family protein